MASVSMRRAEVVTLQDQAAKLPPPRHVAIIMDGNGRWAGARRLPRALGHRMGVEAVRRTIKAAMELGIGCLTLYSFSAENWARPSREVDDLMRLMKQFITRDAAELHASGVRLRVIGERDTVADELRHLIEDAEALTRDNTRLELVVAFNYGARQELTAAARNLAEAVRAGELRPDQITTERLAACLMTAELPEPELLIRTSGEQRLSNFLLWQLAYAELVFLDVKWPDFGKVHLAEAVARFHERERRFGGLMATSSP